MALGGDTDTIACMAGAIAGAHYGFEAIPQPWIRCCEGAEEALQNAEPLRELYNQLSHAGRSGDESCTDPSENQSETKSK